MKALPLFTFLGLVLFASFIPARTNEIWFSPRWQKMLPFDGGTRPIDYSMLFRPGAPWPATESQVAVFKINAHFVKVASDAALDLIFRALREHQIKLAIEMGALSCPADEKPRVEGFFPEPESADFVVQRIKTHGGVLDYVAMDEPYWYGSVYDGRNARHWSAIRIAANAARTMRIFQAAFPGMELGDIEPICDLPDKQPPLIAQYAAWLDALREAWGRPLAFFHADIVWSRPWRDTFAQFGPMLAARHLPLGIIYNAPSSDLDNDHWLAAAQRHYEDMENNGGIVPAQAIFQSWSAMPNRLLPETEPGTHTNLVLRYLRAPIDFTSKRTGSILLGQLRDTAGRPIAHALVHLQVLSAGAGASDDNVSWKDLQVGTTDAVGKVELPLPAAATATGRFRLEFPGDDSHRGGRTAPE